MNTLSLYGGADDKGALIYVKNNFYIPFSEDETETFLKGTIRPNLDFTRFINNKKIKEEIMRGLEPYSSFLKDNNYLLRELLVEMYINNDISLIEFFLLFFIRNNINKIYNYLSYRGVDVGDYNDSNILANILEIIRPHMLPVHGGLTHTKYLGFIANNSMLLRVPQYINKDVAREILYHVNRDELRRLPPLALFYKLSYYNILLGCSFAVHTAQAVSDILSRRRNLYDSKYISLDNRDL